MRRVAYTTAQGVYRRSWLGTWCRRGRREIQISDIWIRAIVAHIRARGSLATATPAPGTAHVRMALRSSTGYLELRARTCLYLDGQELRHIFRRFGTPRNRAISRPYARSRIGSAILYRAEPLARESPGLAWAVDVRAVEKFNVDDARVRMIQGLE